MTAAGDAPNEVYQRLRSHLAYLKLAAVAEALPAELEAARAEQTSHTVFLLHDAADDLRALGRALADVDRNLLSNLAIRPT